MNFKSHLMKKPSTEHVARRQMMPPALRVVEYFVDELTISSDHSIALTQSNSEVLPDDLSIAVSSGHNPENNREWAFSLAVSTEVSPLRPMVCQFSIKMNGLFVVHDTYPETQIERMVNANAAAILYSSAREILAMLTSRTSAGVIILPTVSFLDARTEKERKPSAIPKASSKSKNRKRQA